MIIFMLKTLLITLLLVMLSMPFWPHKFSFSLSSAGYRREYRWRNICFFIESAVLGFVLICFAPLIKNFFDWLFALGIVSWLIGFIPAPITYTVNVLVIIITNMLIALFLLTAKKIFRAFLDKRVFNDISKKNEEKDEILEEIESTPIKKENESFFKRLKQLRHDSVLVFKNTIRKKEATVFSSDYVAPKSSDELEPQTKEPIESDVDDNPITLGEIVRNVWFKFIGIFYRKEENFRYIKTSVFRWTNELKYFLLFMSATYLVVFCVIIIPVVFPIKQSDGFYVIAQWIVNNTYMYPMISLVLLFELLGFIDGDHKDPDEVKDPCLYFATGVDEEKQLDLESHRKSLLKKYSGNFKIKNFITELGTCKNSYNLNEKKKAVQNIAKAIRANKKIINAAYMQGIESMLDDKHILFDSSLYSSLGEYIIHCLFVKLSFGSRVLFICKDEKEIKKATAYLENGFLHITQTNQSLWRICTLSDMYKGQKPDILMLTPDQFLEKDLFIYGKTFFSELVDVFIPDTDKVLAANNYYCLIMAKKLEMYTCLGLKNRIFESDFKSKSQRRIKYRFLSNGHIHSIENSIRQFFNLGDEGLETFNSFGLSSKNDVFVWHTGSSSALYVDNGANQVSIEVQIAKEAEENGISSINLISDTTLYNSHLNEISGLHLNSCDLSEGNIGYVIVADDAFDLPNAIYNYSRYSGRSSSVLHVISKPYLLRDYFTARAENYVSRFELIGETMCEHADPKKAGIIILLCDAVNGIEKDTFLKRAYALLAGDSKHNGESSYEDDSENLGKCVKMCYEVAFGQIQDYQPRYVIRRYLNPKLEMVTYVKLEDSNSLFKKLLESTKTVKLEYVNTQSFEYLPIFKNKIIQHFIPGQIITRNNRPYTIKDISTKNGTLILDDTVPSVNIPMDYIQTRIYHVGKTVSKRMFGPDYRAKDCMVHHIGFELFDAEITVDTVGYYSIEKAVQNVDLVKPNFAKYINLRSNDELLEKLRRIINTKMLVVDLNINISSDPKITYTLTVILNEMMKTVFPNQYRCIAVCPLFDDVDEDVFFAEHGAIRDLYPTIVLDCDNDNSMAENDSSISKLVTNEKTEENPVEVNNAGGHIRFAVIEDTQTSNGVIETLIDGEGIMVTNLLHVVADFLGWALSSAGEDFNYLNFGYQCCPDVFDTTKLESVLKQFKYEIEHSELVKKKNENLCSFCHRVIANNDCQKLEDGRTICLNCVDSTVNSFEALEELFKLVLSSIKEGTSVPESFFKDMACDFVSTKEITERYAGDCGSYPMGYCNHASNSIYIEYGLPTVTAIGIIARLITELWQDYNIVSDGSAIYNGQLDYVELQVLYALEYNSEADALSMVYSENEGLLEFKQLLNNYNTADSFAFLLENDIRGIKRKKRNSVGSEKPEIPDNPDDPAMTDEPDIPEEPVLPDDPDFIIAERTPDNIPRFWYNRISADEKAVYDQIYKAIMELQKNIGAPARNISVDRFSFVVEKVLVDNPDIFWMARNYVQMQYDSHGCITNAIFNYIMTPSEVKRRKKHIEASVKAFLKGINISMSDYTVALLAHENIISLIDYDSLGLKEHAHDVHNDKKPDNLRSIYGVFVEKKAVCAGYAKAFQYLLNRLGIECTYVRGKCCDGEWHAWNLLKLEGEYYYVDVTWDDRSNTDVKKHGDSEIRYDYFAITTKELLKSRNIDDIELYPECKAISCNYFVRNKMYFKEYNAKHINNLLITKLGTDSKSISFKFSSKQLLELFVDRLLKKKGIFDIIKSSDLKKKPSSITHYINEDLNILRIYLDK